MIVGAIHRSSASIQFNSETHFLKNTSQLENVCYVIALYQNCKPADKCLTVGDLRKALEDQKPHEPPPSPVKAIEYPMYKDPPVNAISPGKGKSTVCLLV